MAISKPKGKRTLVSRERGKARGATRTLSRERRAAYATLKRGLSNVERSVAEIERDLRAAEKRVERDARVRIDALRRDARGGLQALRARRREAERLLRKLAAAAEGTWQDIGRAGEEILTSARETAASVVARFRAAVRA